MWFGFGAHNFVLTDNLYPCGTGRMLSYHCPNCDIHDNVHIQSSLFKAAVWPYLFCNPIDKKI